MESISLTGGVTAKYYSFSDHVVCVDINKNGKHMGSFCSDVNQFLEWDKEEMISLIQQHIKLVESSAILRLRQAEKFPLQDQLEFQYYKHTEDLYCIEILQAGKVVSTFCVDCSSFDEWLEDKEQLFHVVDHLIK
ncbi:hypothetical protein SAMN05421736_102269 [Evansella caseinilytica]|uniref:Uncharacterized protein n=1 Tax=Evansella caseinilytica TaxID=1503961 RepID=A0A1H3KVK3_9BACI|nr:hypothetical protein [Evansella caseinilytica]SDY56019.1 hypothetical protein SAMN05421736_102269 [Evansella caseinilytica]